MFNLHFCYHWWTFGMGVAFYGAPKGSLTLCRFFQSGPGLIDRCLADTEASPIIPHVSHFQKKNLFR